MEQNQTLNAANAHVDGAVLLEVGTWLGRHQAFGLIIMGGYARGRGLRFTTHIDDTIPRRIRDPSRIRQIISICSETPLSSRQRGEIRYSCEARRKAGAHRFW